MLSKNSCAFPVIIDDVSVKQFSESGIDVRTYLASRAPIKELIGMYYDRQCASIEECARVAVGYADELISELNKSPTPDGDKETK